MIRVFDKIDTLIEKAAQVIVDTADEAVKKRGRFIIALSGGHSPRPLYELLAGDPWRNKVPWEKTLVLWSDERFVPLEDDRSNAKTALELLLNKVPVPKDQILPMYVDGISPEDAAKRYEAELANLFKTDLPKLDLTLLGCGKDGHTASLFPESAVLDDRDSLVRVVTDGDIPRITMTPKLINRSRQILFLVYGSEKAQAVKKVLADDEDPMSYPARLIHQEKGETLWLLDKQAASKLPDKSTAAEL